MLIKEDEMLKNCQDIVKKYDLHYRDLENDPVYIYDFFSDYAVRGSLRARLKSMSEKVGKSELETLQLLIDYSCAHMDNLSGLFVGGLKRQPCFKELKKQHHEALELERELTSDLASFIEHSESDEITFNFNKTS